MTTTNNTHRATVYNYLRGRAFNHMIEDFGSEAEAIEWARRWTGRDRGFDTPRVTETRDDSCIRFVAEHTNHGKTAEGHVRPIR